MNQIDDFYSDVYGKLQAQSGSSLGKEKIETKVQEFTDMVRLEREKIIRNKGFFNSFRHRLDEWVRTDAIEFIDRPDFPLEKKKAVVHGLHIKSILFSTYKKVFDKIKHDIRRVNQEWGRAYKIIEVAGGEGYLSQALYEMARVEGLSVDIVCTDIVADYLSITPVKEVSCQLRYEQLDALDMNHIPDNTYDIMLVLHSTHHFSLQELAVLVHQAQRTCCDGILAVDGVRSFGNFCFVIGTALLPALFLWNYAIIHDATISARKMYASNLLAGVAKIACPDAQVDSGRLSLGLTYLQVLSTQ